TRRISYANTYKRGVSDLSRPSNFSLVKLFKVCPDCKVEKPVSEFGQNRTLRDGLQFYCKVCCARRGAEVYRRRRAALGKTVRERIDIAPDHKRCARCGCVKPRSEWHRNARSRDGLATYCRECRRELGRLGH